MINIRDGYGYPLQGYDFVPERPKPKDSLSELVKLLQKNRPETRGQTLASSLQQPPSRVFSLQIGEKPHQPEILLLCVPIAVEIDTTASLTLKIGKRETELNYWQDCYETLL